MSDEFRGKVALVTGAAGALGRVVADRFRAGGATVIAVDLRAQPAIVAVDLTDAAATKAAVDDAVATTGRLDVVCNIAGGFAMGETVAALATGANWRAMFDANVTTLLNVCAATVPHLTRQGGAIVNVGAAAALSGKAAMGAYVAAKSAVIRLTESLAAELREQGVNVNCVLPSIIDTPANRADMPKAKFARWVSPSDLAEAIAFLASSRAKAIHGAALPVVGLS
ncbi:MAG: SDR family NAD(P)-dependent oxidoreductase [Alphaproteobacteria bacterium]|nr:SDR family NAD(P)-dependent oxidoreductase [Alphaproteobacteria bacterium]